MFYFSINKKALETIKREAGSTDKEIIGILIGKVYDNLLVVNEVVSGDQASHMTTVKLDNETLAKIIDRIMKGELTGNILGWYHSHPGFGVFMSATDIATQQMLQQFSSKVAALVIDPKEDLYEIFTLDRDSGVTQIPKEQIYKFDDGEDGIPPVLKSAHRLEAKIEVTPAGAIDRIRYVIDGTASFWPEKKCPICGTELRHEAETNSWHCPSMDSAGLKESGEGIKPVEEKKKKKAGYKCKTCTEDLKYSKKLGAWYCKKCGRAYKRHLINKAEEKADGASTPEKGQKETGETGEVIVEAVGTLDVSNNDDEKNDKEGSKDDNKNAQKAGKQSVRTTRKKNKNNKSNKIEQNSKKNK